MDGPCGCYLGGVYRVRFTNHNMSQRCDQSKVNFRNHCYDLSILPSSTSLKWQNRWHRTFIYQRVSSTGPWLSSCWAIKKFTSSTYQTILVVNELVSSGNMKTIPSGQPAWQQKIDFSSDFAIRNIEVYVIHIHMIYWHDNITLLSIHYWRMRYKIPKYQLLPTF